jgi:hypothetical protein
MKTFSLELVHDSLYVIHDIFYTILISLNYYNKQNIMLYVPYLFLFNNRHLYTCNKLGPYTINGLSVTHNE